MTRIPADATDAEDIASVTGYLDGLGAAVPVLTIDDAQDGCGASPPDGARALASAVGDAHDFFVIDGGPGPPAGSDPCGGVSRHGFFGLEGPVVAQVVAFVAAR